MQSTQSITADSQTDWERINAMQDEDIDLSDIPDMTEEQMARAVLRVNGKPVPPNKARTNLVLLAPDVAAAFPNAEAVNAALRLVIQMAKIPTNKKKRAMRAAA